MKNSIARRMEEDRRYAAIAAALASLVIVGCGSGDPFSYVKVSGSVAYEDGSPIPSDAIIVTFAPQAEAIDEQFHPRSGMAYADAQGNFDTVTSYKYGDGIVKGRHKVLVSIRGGAPSVTDKRTGKKVSRPLIPEIYTSLATTPIEVHTDDAPFDLKIAKPGS
ncbi:MAG: hypothetical protein AAF266_08220 [Planctomycetota bacterium]